MKKLIATMIIGAFATTSALAHESTENNRPKPAEEVAKMQQAPVKGESKPKGHSGGTDSKGCHTNHSTGEYHCHNPK